MRKCHGLHVLLPSQNTRNKEAGSTAPIKSKTKGLASEIVPNFVEAEVPSTFPAPNSPGEQT